MANESFGPVALSFARAEAGQNFADDPTKGNNMMTAKTTNEQSKASAEAERYLAICEGRGKPTTPRAVKPVAANEPTSKIGRATAEWLAACAVVAASGVKTWQEAATKLKLIVGKRETVRQESDPLKHEVWEVREWTSGAKELADIGVENDVVSEDGVPVGPVVVERKLIFHN